MTLSERPLANLYQRIARHSRLTHAIEQTLTNLLYAVLVGGICIVLFS